MKNEPNSKVAQKQRDILMHARNVFAKEGFGDTDVQVIADLAGVGKGTVYRHFGNKEQLFLATAKFCMEEMGASMRKRLGQPDEDGRTIEQVGAAETLQRIARAYAEFYEQNPQAVEIMIQERAQFRESVYPSHLMHRAEKRAEFDQFLSEAISRGELREGDVTHVTNVFADLLYGTVVNGCLEGGKGKLVQRVEQAVNLLLIGLVIQEGLPARRRTKRKT